MIQATELRIGDIVTLNGNHRLFSVIELKRDFAYLKTGNSCWVDYGYSELRGVPITAEVLEKCGFKMVKERYRKQISYRKGSIFLHWRQKRNAWMINVQKQPINYLHQLQNYAHACYGIELTYTPHDHPHKEGVPS